MKTFKLFSMAALILLMAACNEFQQPAQQAKMHFTATLAAPNSDPTTRTTATADGSNYNVAWAVDDEIALVYQDTHGNKQCDKVKVKTVDPVTGAATIEGDITSTVNDGDPVTLVYPFDRVGSADYTDLGKSYAPNLDPFAFQKGTIADGFTDGLDWREGPGTFSVTGSGVTLSGNVTMNPNVAIWKINLTTDGSNPINAESVRMILNAQLNPSLVMPAIVCEASIPGGASSIYMFIPICVLDDLYTMDPSASMTFDVQDNNYDYFENTYNTKLSLTASKIYESNLTLNPLLYIDIIDSYEARIYYYAGEKWAEAIANHIFRNRTWEIEGGRLKHNTYYLKDSGGNDIDPTTTPNPLATYKWSDL